MKRIIITAIALAVFFAAAGAPPQSRLVSMDGEGRLRYHPYTEQGDILPDFSHCGYRGGGVALPDVPVAVVLTPSGGDDHPAIQAAIDRLAAGEPGPDGFRGAVQLKKGVYNISRTLVIPASGIVLRGEGNDKENGTVLLATSPHQYNVIEIGVRGRLTKVEGTERPITDEYVPSGSRTVHIADAGRWFAPGDRVVVHRPSTREWISAIGMDSIPPRPLPGETSYDSFERFRRDGANTNTNGTVQWQPGTKDLLFERTVTAVDGDRVTLDIPVVNALQREYGGATVYKYEFPERISDCGVENLYGMALFDETVTAENRYIGTHCVDEDHANNFVYCRAVENAWIRDVSVEHFDCCVWTEPSSKFITGQDLSATNPVSVITGGRRYSYSVAGQMCLFQRCYASHHRHQFVLGASVPGPNTFVDGYGDVTFASSEPHQRWAAGCLYDNIVIRGPDGSLLAANRGWFGSGHGWSGAQIVFWNCTAPVIMPMRPPTAQNFAIGYNGKAYDQWEERARESTICSINGVSRSNFVYEGTAAVGDGWIEHADTQVWPRSLYYRQLRDRLGEEAVRNVTTRYQQHLVY
ncbi:MAG: glycoside hydrolase family 55 protein [Rikenellaceae bacterium]|nr:glycoside hydrolase family 55 protein [Rikenellaceae bacterium]